MGLDANPEHSKPRRRIATRREIRSPNNFRTAEASFRAQSLKTTWATKAACGQGDLNIDVPLDVGTPFERARVTIGR